MCLAQGRIGCETLRQAWFWLFAPLSQGSRLSTIPASENLSIEYTPLYLEQGVSFSPFYVILWRFRPKPQLRINRTSCHEWVTLSCKISILLERPLTLKEVVLALLLSIPCPGYIIFSHFWGLSFRLCSLFFICASCLIMCVGSLLSPSLG